jgi:uncharacterized membrane protein YdbT with pleckstrin-like domain
MTRHPEWLTLDGDESLVWAGRPRTMSIAGTVLGALVRTIVLVAVGWLLMGTALQGMVPGMVWTAIQGIPSVVPLGIVGVAVLWGVAEVTWAWLVLSNVDYVLTDRNVYKKTGVGSENVKRVGLDRVQSTSLSKDLFGNVFDYGSVSISTAGGSGVEMEIADLDTPDELRQELRRLVNRTGGGGATRRAAGAVTVGNEELLGELVQEATELRERAIGVEEVLEP